jgi:dTDP-4-dehydrorhamnose reductase
MKHLKIKTTLEGARVLVFGSSGQVGKSIKKVLSSWQNVTYCERNPTDPQTHVCDLTDHSQIRDLIKKIQPQYLINCAAYTAVDKAESDQDACFQINAAAPEVMAKMMAETNGFFIHYSTDYVFDGSGYQPHQETDPTNPINLYGRSKLAGDLAALKYCPNSYIFRTQWVYDRTGKNFVNTMLRLGAEKDELSIVDDQFGAPTSSDLIAKFTLLAIEQMHAGNFPAGIYNLAAGGETTWKRFAEKIFAIARSQGINLKVKTVKPVPTEAFPTPAKRPSNSRLSLKKLELALGVRIPDWDDELLRIMTGRSAL